MIKYTLKEFIELFTESAHPELQQVLKAKPGYVSKARLVAKKINELIGRGESTGVEDKMPKGSSRAYVKESSSTPVIVDGKKSSMHTGYKIAIPASLDRSHDHKKYEGTLGQMQMRAENGDYFLNDNYRVLTKVKNVKGQHHFESNTERGIFPPLLDHDYDHHSWSHIAHVDKLGANFRSLTKTPTHPKGISHEDFCETLERAWHKDHGKWWKTSEENEKRMDHNEEHPLVQKFLDHQRTFGMPPHDYRQRGNMGVWTHPVSGEQHIVARDHGFNEEVMKAYKEARKKAK